MPYGSIDQLYDYLPQTTRGEHDAVLSDVLERATAIVEGELGFQFSDYGANAEARDIRHSRGQYLRLPGYQAGSITKVEEIAGRGTTSETAGEVTEYIEESDGRLYYDPGWTAGAWYRIEARWGYGPPPDDIVEVTLEVAVNIWRGRDASQWSASIGVEGQGSVSYNRALTWAQRSIIEAVRTRYQGVIHA